MRIPAVAIISVCCGLLASSAASQTALPSLPVVELAPPPPFPDWLALVRVEAVSRGISEATLSRTLDGLEPLPVVLDRDRNQAELVLTLDQYLARRLTRPTIRMAEKMRRQHRQLLRRVSERYKVPAEVIVSVWGLESNFGRFSGVRPTIATLATLAYDQRRSLMFREELFSALKIIEGGDVEPAGLRGSWAGALGQPQFMPSSFLEYAQDFDGDGRRDIWKSAPDVFASIAYFLNAHGWHASHRWGREVKVPPRVVSELHEIAPFQTAGCLAQREMTVALPLDKWRDLGVTTVAGSRLPSASIDASLVPAGDRYFLVYPNYQAILSYNCVHAYALSVALLSDKLR